MDTAGRTSGARTPGRQADVPRGATAASTPKSPGRRGDSKTGRLSRHVVSESLLSEGVEPASSNIALQLRVPRGPVKIKEPGTELREFLRRERFDLLLELLDLTHGHVLPECGPYHTRALVPRRADGQPARGTRAR